MNKQILALSAAALLATLPSWAVVKIAGNDTEYASVSAAMADAESGSIILVTESYLEETTINPGTKKITIKGDDGVVISYKGQYVVTLNDNTKECSLTIENITFRNTLTAANTRNVFAISRGSFYLKDVVIDGANVNNPSGIISLNTGSGNILAAEFDNVKIVNSEVTGAPAQVVVANSNLVLKGDTEMSIQLLGNSTVKDASEFSGNACLVLDAGRALDEPVVYGCTDASRFTLEGVSDAVLKAVDGNLVLAEMDAVVNESTGVGYASLADAVKAAVSGDVIVLNSNVTLPGRITLGGKTLTIKGATGNEKITRAEGLVQYLFLTSGEEDALTLENLTVDGNNVELAASMLQPQKGASVTLRNVKVVDCITTNARGLLDCGASGTWHLDEVVFENCTVPNQHVTANGSGNTITGNNSLTLRINDRNTVDATGIDNETPVEVTLGNPAEDAPVFTGCTDPGQFACKNANYSFVTDGNGLKLYDTTSSAIEDVIADGVAGARWYTLQGVAVDTPSVSGIYIWVSNGYARKIYVK